MGMSSKGCKGGSKSGKGMGQSKSSKGMNGYPMVAPAVALNAVPTEHRSYAPTERTAGTTHSV